MLLFGIQQRKSGELRRILRLRRPNGPGIEPMQYVVLSCDSKGKYSKISWDALAIAEKSLSLHHELCSTVRDKRLTHVEKP